MLCNHTPLHLPWRCFVMQDGDRPTSKVLDGTGRAVFAKNEPSSRTRAGQDVWSLDGSPHVMRSLLAATRPWRHATSQTLPRFPEPSGSRRCSPDWRSMTSTIGDGSNARTHRRGTRVSRPLECLTLRAISLHPASTARYAAPGTKRLSVPAAPYRRPRYWSARRVPLLPVE